MNPATNPLDMFGPLMVLRGSSRITSTVPTLKGKRVGFTGELKTMDRVAAQNRVWQAGGKPVGNCQPCDIIVEGTPWCGPDSIRSTASILAEQNGAAAIDETTLVALLTGAA